MERVRFSRDVTRQLRILQARGSRGLWAMALFLALSIGAHRDFDLLSALPEPVKNLLSGAVPPTLVSAALVLYTFAAISRTLSNIALGSGQYGGFLHAGFLGAFYFFYQLAGALRDNFWAVFAAGAIILSLESYHIWTYHQILVRELEKLVLRLEEKDDSG